jgi:hypothetical protein
MSSQSSEQPFVVAQPSEERPQPPIELVPAPTPEQVRAADAVFTHKKTEEETAAGILGFWASGMLLKDIIQDTLTPPADEEVEEEKKNKKVPPPQQ